MGWWTHLFRASVLVSAGFQLLRDRLLTVSLARADISLLIAALVKLINSVLYRTYYSKWAVEAPSYSSIRDYSTVRTMQRVHNVGCWSAACSGMINYLVSCQARPLLFPSSHRRHGRWFPLQLTLAFNCMCPWAQWLMNSVAMLLASLTCKISGLA